MSPTLSVIICTYNGVSKLPKTLFHLSKQVFENVIWEIILVDNNSSDNTLAVSQSIWEKYNSNKPLKVFKADKQGKTFAWETGLRHSQSDFVMICDDDNWLEPDYIQKAVDIINGNPSYAALGGRSEAVFEVAPPKWFCNYSKSYAVGKQYDEDREVTFEDTKLWGAGTIFRKSAITYLYNNGFQHLFKGIRGQGMAEDHELCFALRLAGFRLFYTNQLCFKHYVTKSRLNWSWYLNFFKESAVNSYLFDPYEKALDNRISSNSLKRTAFYPIYLSIRRILKINFSFKYFLYPPQPNSNEEWFECYYHKHRITGLFTCIFKYRRLLNSVSEAKWIKKDN